ncbi:hypothetical protein ACFFUS_10425 [Vibrio gallaecicus]|uniref:hypothetical protein n=1 Tax=Vibrio gallaecicus TaxID=552386 RepID=UPI0010C9F824|nr:hypothetical protein [Vibrio gallaecicus]MDN3616787.1 hypothetical protein [Vibrio gallaecicus]
MNNPSIEELQKRLSPYIDDQGQLTLRSQDIYVIRQNGHQATLINHKDYTSDAMKCIEWCYSPSDYHFFFGSKVEDQKLQQINIMGPALTKVLPWNLSNAQCPPDVNITDLEPGYLLDLRVLQLNRLRAPLRESPQLDVARDTPISKLDPNSTAPIIKFVNDHVPLSEVKQLKQPVPENLYIVSYVNPLLVRDDNQFYPYHIHYLSLDNLNSLETLNLEHGAEDDLNQLQETIEELKASIHRHQDDLIPYLDTIKQNSDTLTAQSLARYYRDAGVQVGAVNPKDLQEESLLVGTVCTVANLQSFLK